MPLKKITDYHYGPDRERTAPTHVYECTDCPVRSDCTFGEDNRSIQFIRTLEDWKQTMHKQEAREKGKR